MPTILSSDASKTLGLTAAAVAILVTSFTYYASAFGTDHSSPFTRRRRRQRRDYYKDVPPEILRTDFDDDDFICECKEELILAVRIAQEAGQNMMQHYNTKGTTMISTNSSSSSQNSHVDLDISIKTNSCDIATAIDTQNEDYISSQISSHFPTHAIIGEESVGSGPIPPLSSTVPTWIIDPIDGTTNFVSGLPLCCVSVGLCIRGQPYMGVVYAPMTQELYIGVRGRGAYRNGVRLSSSSSSAEQKKKTLAESVVCFEFGYERTEAGITSMIDPVHRLLLHGVRATRSLGSGVLNLCYIASGRLDLVYAGMASEGWKPWDYCAGLVVAVEAGCCMTHLKMEKEDMDENGNVKCGYDFNLYSKSMICGVEMELVEEAWKVILG